MVVKSADIVPRPRLHLGVHRHLSGVQHGRHMHRLAAGAPAAGGHSRFHVRQGGSSHFNARQRSQLWLRLRRRLWCHHQLSRLVRAALDGRRRGVMPRRAVPQLQRLVNREAEHSSRAGLRLCGRLCGRRGRLCACPRRLVHGDVRVVRVRAPSLRRHHLRRRLAIASHICGQQRSRRAQHLAHRLGRHHWRVAGKCRLWAGSGDSMSKQPDAIIAQCASHASMWRCGGRDGPCDASRLR